MPIVSAAAMNASLDNDYGVTRGPNAADAHLMALYDGDPREGGVELNSTDCPGYARVTVDELDWNAAAAGAKSTSLMQFPASTDSWAQQATWFALFDASDPTVMWDAAPLSDVLIVTAANPVGPSLVATVFYGDAVINADD